MDISRAMAGICLLLLSLLAAALAKDPKDMMKKSIVFDKNTPDVFYCPQSKPTGFDKMIVRARPLKKLCEHDGQPLPEDYKSDCYNDVDETSYACKEKYRIMKRLVKPKTPDEAESTPLSTYMKAFTNDDVNRPSQTRASMRIHPPGSDNADNHYPFVRSHDKVIKVKSNSKVTKVRRTKHRN